MRNILISLLLVVAQLASGQSEVIFAPWNQYASTAAGCSINAADTFHRANENPLSQGGNWKLVSGQGALQVSGNVCTWTNCASPNGEMYFDGALGWTNCPSQTSSTWVTGGPNTAAGGGWGPFVRCSPTVRTYYEAIVWQGNVRLEERISGVGNTQLADITVTYVTGAELTLSVTGSDLTNNVNLIVTYNNVQLTNMHPFHVITNGFPGIRYSSADSTCLMAVTNWVGSSP